MTLLRWLAWGEWRAQPVRNALSVAAIAIGVALGFAVHLVNAVALENFTGGLNKVRGAADLQIVGASRGFDEAVFGRLHADPIAASIAVASPVIERDVVPVDDPGIALRITGADFLRAVRVTPALIGRPQADRDGTDAATDSPASPGSGWFDADAIFVSASLLDALKKRVGEPLVVQVDGRAVTLRIAGLLAEDDDAARDPSPSNPAGSRRVLHASMDIAGAQWKLDRLGRLTRIDLRLVEGADPEKVRAAIAALLPADTQVVSAADDRARTGDLSRAYRVNLDMLALMALFTGAFLVYSTQSLAVARRRAQLALLRVIGVTRGRVVAQVLAEGTLQGIVGGLLGLAAGVAFAAVALRFLGGDLGGGFFASSANRFDLHRLVFAAPDAALLFFVLGLAAALVGSYFPARAAARAAPAVALKSAGDDASLGRPSPWLAAGLVVVAAICAAMPAVAGLPILGYVSMTLLLFGGIAAMPSIVQWLLAPLARSGRPRAVALDLALRRLWAAPSAASVALCGIVASASMMVAMTVMIGSFRHSVDEWLGQVLQADLYLRTGNAGEGGLAPDDVDRLRRVDGVRRIELQKVVPLNLSPSRPAVSLVVRGIDAAHPRDALPLIAAAPTASTGDAIPVWVSEAMVDLYGAAVGQPFALPIVPTSSTGPATTARYVVAGVWRDYARQFGSVVMRREDYTRLTGDARFTDAAIDLVAPGPSTGAVVEGLRAALPERLRRRAEFAEPGAIRKLSLQIFDRSFAVTYLLQAVAIAIGLAGVAATFSAQTLARSKEFGMLRHIGVLKRQIVAELAAEGALLGVLGALAGGLLGLATSQVLIHVVNPQSFHWTMDTYVPWRTLGAVGLALIGSAAGTAAFSGRRALGHDAVLAVREDW